MRRRIIKGIFLVIIIVFIVSALYGWYISTQIEKRFSGRRWSVPSRVFSDTTLLYPGQIINRVLFDQKLRKLGYRNVPHRPMQKGEMWISSSVIDIFLHDLEIPLQKRDGFPVRIKFFKDQIVSIDRLDYSESMPILELEPQEIMLYFGRDREKRRLISISQIPQHLIYSVLGAEDCRFYKHNGIDPRGIIRAMYANIRHGSIRQGGSTITQQLARNYFLTLERTFLRKFKEVFISFIIEGKYSKNEILEIYFNEIYLGQKGSISINGMGEAAYFYFGKPVAELSLAESAAIAGLIKAPNYYSPYIDTERCRKRRNIVLRSMHKNGWISRKELEKGLEAHLKPFGYILFGRDAPYFTDYVARQLRELYSPEALSSLGLSIYTTLDTQVQVAAEKALVKGLALLEKSIPSLDGEKSNEKLQGAIIVMQPKTGYILAMVGGRNYNESQFNRITQAKRQPGSAFKPFVYLSGLDTLTPASILSNEPKAYEIDGKIWEPHNFEPEPLRQVCVRTALARSLNLATVDAAMKIGLDKITKTANAFHFSTPTKPYPSLALGAFEIIPMELARSYCVFAADGVLPYPLSLKDVLDERNEVLEQRYMTVERVTSREKAFIMSSLMQSVVQEGTAKSLAKMGISFPVAGKTGTTNDFRDAWFVGYTPDILALVWVGFDNGEPVYATGSAAALPIWADLLQNIPQHVSNSWFRVPQGVVQRGICSETGALAVRYACPYPVTEYFLEENVPDEYCRLHCDPLKKIIKGVEDVFKKF